jgi:hypothetical protein
MDISQGKVFEKAVGGSYLGTIVDVVDMPNQKSSYGGVTKDVNRVRIQWILGHTNNTQYLDTEGQPMTVVAMPIAGQSPNSKLNKLLTQILNGAPPLIQNTEDLARLLIGRTNELFLVQEPSTKVAGEFYTNVAGVAPLKPGQVAPPIPAGFVRFKDRPKTQAGPQGRPVQTYAQAPQQQQQPATNSVSLNAATAGAPTPEAF